MNDTIEGSVKTRKHKTKRMGRIAWLTILHVLDLLTDAVENNWAIISRESDLFLGSLLTLLGLLNFQSSKYCDGNAADYLSCTRPTTYYYYNGLEVALVIIGTFFILLWFLKRKKS